jgi:glycosyltransferase involved in cell wall biosynthesis
MAARPEGRSTRFINQIRTLIDKGHLGENLRLTGAVPGDRLRRLFNACDIFVLPSLAETFGLVVAEAMAFAKPVVGTRVPGISQQIKDGWNGFLAEPADEADIARKIIYLIDRPSLRRKMGQNGRRYAEQELGWQMTALKILEIYNM